MKNIKAKRELAQVCLNLSYRFQEWSPAAREFLGAFGGTSQEAKKDWLRRWINKKISKWSDKLMLKTLFKILDTLVLTDDFEVRIKAVRAMAILNYRSKHLGLIATFYNSGERGFVSGTRTQAEKLSEDVWSYFSSFLKIPDFFEELRGQANHWEGVLRIDYRKDFSVEEKWNLSGRELVHVRREIPPEEVERRLKERREEILRLYQASLSESVAKQLAGYYDQRYLEVRESVEDIIKYLFSEKLDNIVIEDALYMLAKTAGWKKFPEKWLLEFANKYAKTGG